MVSYSLTYNHHCLAHCVHSSDHMLTAMGNLSLAEIEPHCSTRDQPCSQQPGLCQVVIVSVQHGRGLESLHSPLKQTRMGQAKGPVRVSQPGPSLGKGLPTYTARRGPASLCPALRHTTAFPSFLAKRRDSRGSGHYGSLEAMFGGHQKDSRQQEWIFWLPVIPMAGSGGWRDADRHLPWSCLHWRILFSFP